MAMFIVTERTEFGIKVKHQEGHEYLYVSARAAGDAKRVLGTATMFEAGDAHHSAPWFEPEARRFAEAEARKARIID